MEVLVSLTTLTILTIVAVVLAIRFREWMVFGHRPFGGRDIGAEQPIPFSHRVHSGVKNIQCQYCHPYVGRSIHPGLPPVEKCLHCHNHIIANHPQILKEHAYYNTKTPTPWVKANYLAEHVLFNHQRHIKKEIQCQECHGEIKTMDRIRGRYFYMEFCINCHREKKVNLGCWLACHS